MNVCPNCGVEPSEKSWTGTTRNSGPYHTYYTVECACTTISTDRTATIKLSGDFRAKTAAWDMWKKAVERKAAGTQGVLL